MLLEQHLVEPSVVKLKHNRRAKGRYAKSKKLRRLPVDSITLTYFVNVVLGSSTGFLAKFKARINVKQQSKATNYEGSGSVNYFLITDKDGNINRTVIDCLKIATDRFTPAYLCAINRYRQNTVDDQYSVTIKGYWVLY